MAVVAVAATCLVISPPALAGDPFTSIKVNEVESEGFADFIELANVSATATDVSGLVLKDNDDSRTLAIPDGTSVPAGGFLAVDTDVPGGFGLSSSDAARVFMPDGITQIDGHTWAAHAATSLGRCPDGTGAFITTGAVTKGGANSCPPPLVTQPWPGSSSVTTVDQTGVLTADVSGLAYEGSGSSSPGVLWAVDDNSGGLLQRLVWDGTQWVRDTANGWSAGKTLRYPGGAGTPDSEGVALTDAGAAGGVYVSSERDATNSGVSRPSVLRYDVSGAGATLTATQEWNLTADLPSVGANAGAESVEWVPDSYLVESGFVDQATGAAYNPATYPNHGTGLFFVGLEANGIVYAYALDGPQRLHPRGDLRQRLPRPLARCTGSPGQISCGWSATTTAVAAAAPSRSTRSRARRTAASLPWRTTRAPRAWPTSTTRASPSRRPVSASEAASRSSGLTTATPAAMRCEPAPSAAQPRRTSTATASRISRWGFPTRISARSQTPGRST